MASSEINRSREMSVFVNVVEHGSFSAAAKICRMTPSAVSKVIGRLEARLNVRLINRSTRSFQLTAEGCGFYERAARILVDIEDAERSAGAGDQPSGRIRLSTSASYATHILAPILPEFLARHPGITLDLILTDAVVDLFAERIDVAVRAGPLRTSSLLARKLGETPTVVVAASGYLQRRGMPRTIDDLDGHDRLGFGYIRAVDGWPLRQQGEAVLHPVAGRISASDGEALRQLALNGSGVARLALFTVRGDLASGRLIRVLEAFDPGDQEAFYAVHAGGAGPLPSRIRELLDFLASHGRVE